MLTFLWKEVPFVYDMNWEMDPFVDSKWGNWELQDMLVLQVHYYDVGAQSDHIAMEK